MGWSKYGLLALLLIIIFTVSVFGGHFGYTVEGVPKGYSEQAEEEEVGFTAGALLNPSDPYWDKEDAKDSEPGLVSMITDAVRFLYHMSSFQVDGMPELISVIFIIMSLMTVFLFVSLARGSG